MIEHTFYRVIETEYSNRYGAEYSIKEITYCTNDSGCGLFDETCINQITGNGQFCGGREAVRRFFDDPKSTDNRVLSTLAGAKRVCNKLQKNNPLRKIPVHQYSTGQKIDFSGHKCTVISQSGRDVTIHPDEMPDDYTSVIKDYDIF